MTTPTPPLLPLASTGCGCCAPSTPSETVSAAPVGTTDATPDLVTIYQVTGMSCGHCAASVTKALTALPQVTDVHVDLEAQGTSRVTVTGTVSSETVRQAIEQAGYTIIS